MNFQWYDPPRLLKKMFPGFIWESKVGKLLITLDDGPSIQNTGRLLNYFGDHDIKTVMFFVGEAMKKNPQLVREVIAAGHTVGCHSMTHKAVTAMTYSQFSGLLDEYENLYRSIINDDVKYFRPPYGRFNFTTVRALKKHKITNVMWSLLTFDYKNDFDIVKFAVTKYLRNNSLIVFHDNLKSKDILIDSLNFLMEQADKLGYQFGEPAECLK